MKVVLYKFIQVEGKLNLIRDQKMKKQETREHLKKVVKQGRSSIPADILVNSDIRPTSKSAGIGDLPYFTTF